MAAKSTTAGAPPHDAARRRGAAGLWLGLLALAASCLLAFSLGAYPVTAGDLATWLWATLRGVPSGLDRSAELVITEIRGPRVLVAIVVGGALATAGAAYQGLFRNPLVSPDILGVSSGAALGAVTGIFLSLPLLMIQGLAFAGGLVAVALVYAVATFVRGRDPVLILVLAGIVIGTLLGAGVSMIKVLADPYDQLPAITFWLLGSLAAVNLDDLLTIAPLFALAAVPLVALHWRMNVMTLGEEEARSLGVDTTRVRIAVIFCATLMTAAVVSVSGIVGWVGLVIPHIARFLAGPSFGRLLPVAMLLGGAFMLLVDTLARTIGPMEIPLGVLTAVVGAPIFIWVLATARRDWQ